MQLSGEQVDRIAAKKVEAVGKRAARLSETVAISAANVSSRQREGRQELSGPIDVVGPGESSEAASNEQPCTGPRDGGRNKIRKTKQPGRQPQDTGAAEWPEGPHGSKHCWSWPNDASLSLLDEAHRKAGWWAIDTVNANAWPAGADYMARTAADVVLAQEVKVPNGYPREAAEQAARGVKWGGPLSHAMSPA